MTASPGLAAPHHGLPPAVFPAHAHLHYHATVSNATIDCVWSFAVCDLATGLPVTSQPAMHARTMDQLHRLGGWEEEGVVSFRMSFVLWDNRFPSPARAVAGCHDMARAQRDTGFPKSVPAQRGASGERGWTDYLFGGSTMNLLCAWNGTTEIESASTWETGNTTEGSIARRYQRLQIEAALNGA
jgi:hypothetical protein